MPQFLKDKIIFSGEDWTLGLNSQSTGGATVSLVNGASIASATSFNPHRPNGIASPGYGMGTVTNVSAVTGPIVGGINKQTDLQKGILVQSTNGLIQEITYSTSTITNGGGTFPHTIDHAHTAETGEDIVAYSVGSTRYAFYSFRDNTDWDIGRYDYVTTFVDNYMSTVAATPLAAPYLTGGKSAPHPMIVGADDVLYIADRNFLHGFDGQVGGNGTFEAAILTLPAGYIITSFTKTQSYLILYAYRADQTADDGSTNAEATAFFWNYIDPDPSQVIDLNDNYVNGGFLFNGQPACFTTGRPQEGWEGTTLNKKADLRIYDGSGFPSIVSFDGTLPAYRGVDVLADEILWNSGGAIFSYAEKIKGNGWKLNKTSAASGATSAFLKTMTSNQQYISSGSTSSGGLELVAWDTYAASSLIKTILVQPPQNYRQINRLKMVEIRLYSLGSTGNYIDRLAVQYLGSSFTNNNSSQTIIDDAFFTKYNNAYETDTSSVSLSDFSRIGLIISWVADGLATGIPPQIDSVILHHEPINI